MQLCECPRLRPHVQPAQLESDHRHVYLVDRLGLAETHRLTLQEYHWVRLFDGQRSAHDIREELVRQLGGEIGSLDTFDELVRRLEDHAFLDGPRFQELAQAPVREPRFIGCYEGDPERLRRQFSELFARPGGPGRPKLPRPDGRLRGALLPHIDYPRSGSSYAWGFKEVFERTDASLFVIIGTSHYSRHRFTLTRKSFRTPLGIVPTDQEYVDRLVAHYGDGLFEDELLAHLPEHSIELEAVFLHYLYENVRPIRIVPLVVGSFHDCIDDGIEPRECSDIGRMIEAIRQAESATREPICYILSGDLAHIGPKFGASQPLQKYQLQHSQAQDEAVLREAERASAAGYFKVIADERDARNICGLPPTYVFLESVRPSHGKLLNYGQYVHPRGQESVSFASMSFFR